MKKIYFSLILLTVAFGAEAQKSQQTPVKLKSDNVAPFGQVRPTQMQTSVRAGGPIWDDDFSTAGIWTVGNSGTPSANWVVGTAPPSGDFAIPAIQSTTAANGFAKFDSDALGSNTSVQNAWIRMTNPVDLSAYNSVVLRFQQYYRKYQDDTFVEVSTNGTTWTSFEVNASLVPNASTSNPNTVELNISSVAASQPQVWVRFRFAGGWDYAWMVDDVEIVSGSVNDLMMADVWHGDIFNAYEYEQIPLSQSQQVIIGAASLNNGSAAQTNVTYSYIITRNGSTVANGSFPAGNASLASSGRDTTWYPTGYVPSSLGDYVVFVTVAASASDETPSNNIGSSDFKITQSIYAHDEEESLIYQIYGGQDVNSNAVEYKAGLMYELIEDATLYGGVQVAFGSLTTTDVCIINVYDRMNDPDLDSPILTEVYDIQPGDIPTGGNVVYTTIPLGNGFGIPFTAGIYLITIGNAGPGERLYVLASDGDDDYAGLRYGPYGAGGAIDWYTGFGNSPVIRAYFGSTVVGVDESGDLAADVQLYPNPASNELTIAHQGMDGADMQINIIGMDGRSVYARSVAGMADGSVSTISLDGIATGVYTVQLTGNAGMVSKKLCVVK